MQGFQEDKEAERREGSTELCLSSRALAAMAHPVSPKTLLGPHQADSPAQRGAAPSTAGTEARKGAQRGKAFTKGHLAGTGTDSLHSMPSAE